MFSLNYKQDDSFVFENVNYRINASFDVVLKIIDMLNEKHLAPAFKIQLGLKLFLGKDTDSIRMDISQQSELFNSIFEKYVGDDKQSKNVDLKGNPLPVYKKDKSNFYSLKHDAEYIYASFFQAYGIDLLEQQGKLHWFKFQALLSGLPEDTKFRQIVSIRMWVKPKKGDKEEVRMKNLQKIYALPDESEVTDDG